MKRRSQIYLSGCILAAMLPLVAAAPANHGTELGRLFTTPAERAAIDRLRGMSSRPVSAITSDSDAAILLPADIRTPASVRLQGVVRRSDGSNEVWLDGGRTGMTGGMNVQGRIPVRIPGTDRQAWMKPGQVLDTVTGTVRESYQAGHAGP